jgi:hypothetical protein
MQKNIEEIFLEPGTGFKTSIKKIYDFGKKQSDLLP